MKIVIAYYSDENTTDEHDIPLADAIYKSDSIESAEYDLGRLERFIKKSKRIITDADTDF